MTDKHMKLRMPDGTWVTVGVPSRPIYMRMPDNTWKIFGDGGGQPLKVRDDNFKSWTEVSTSGMTSGIVTGLFYEFDPTFTIYTPLKNKTVQIYSSVTRLTQTVQTDYNGKFKFTNLSFGPFRITAYKSHWYPETQLNITLDSENPIRYVELGTPETYDIETYHTMDVFATNRFIWNVGWTAEQRQTFEWRNNPSGFVGNESYTYSAANLNASSYSTTGWTGATGAGDYGTDYRYKDETLGWYSVPVGMFLDAANTYYELSKINDPQGWTANSFLEKIEVVHNLTGYSVEKSQVSWMNHYYFADTTLGLYGGVGSLRYQGHTPNTNPANLLTGIWNNGVYTVPTVRDHAYVAETGVSLWTGNLNDLGVQNGVHGLPVVEPYTVTQTFVPAEIPDVMTALQYHVQTSSLPDPVSFAEADAMPSHYFTRSNVLSDVIDVKVYFKWH